MKRGSHPKKIGRYTLLNPIGRGGMSIVYRAFDSESEMIVALKFLYPLQPMVELMGMEKLKDIFTAESRKMEALNHPNIVKVLDLELGSRTPYFAMEYHCTNIGMLINENFILEEATRIISREIVFDYGKQILEGLRFIHAAGIIHRDIKPHNILVTDMDTAKICDFGTAIQEDDEIFDSTRLKVGSPYYIAPEQDRNPESADQRSDLYSVAVMLYRMLTGRLPEGGGGIPLSSINPIYGEGEDDFFRKALAPDPSLRFQNVQEMLVAFMNFEVHPEREINAACLDMEDRNKPDTSHRPGKIRNSLLRVAGAKAREAFQVNKLWQPEQYMENIFTAQNDETVTDMATGLIWQKKNNGVPVDYEEAISFITVLNDTQESGIATWRLPTVNELLTLVSDPLGSESLCPSGVWQDEKQWYWSCDHRSENTSWYVNTRLGYTGWQENSCRNYVRAVASLNHE